MKARYSAACLAIATVFISIAVVGCAASIGQSSSFFGVQGRAKRDFPVGVNSTLEQHTVTVANGEEIVLTYDVTVRTGEIQITVWQPLGPRGPQKQLAHRTVRKSGRDSIVVPVESPYNYDIWVRPMRFGGSYDVGWAIR